MDLPDLKKIFLATALTTIVVGLAATVFSFEWAVRYFAVGGLALVNWIALALILVGVFARSVTMILGGFALKPVVLGALLYVVMNLGLEISSFLAGMNTFFLVLFVYMAFFGGAQKARSVLDAMMQGEDRING